MDGQNPEASPRAERDASLPTYVMENRTPDPVPAPPAKGATAPRIKAPYPRRAGQR